MLVQWTFERADGSVKKALLDELELPARGDGKIYDGVGYEVKTVITKMVSSKYPNVFAIEDLKGHR